MKPLFNRIYKVAGSIHKLLTPTDEEVRRRVERYEAIYSDYHFDKLK